MYSMLMIRKHIMLENSISPPHVGSSGGTLGGSITPSDIVMMILLLALSALMAIITIRGITIYARHSKRKVLE